MAGFAGVSAHDSCNRDALTFLIQLGGGVASVRVGAERD
jgi:hypothetical protein